MGRQTPYSSFNYLVNLGPQFGPAAELGGFQEVSGLTLHMTLRSAGTPIRIGGAHRVGDVTLKRGVVNSWSLWNWITQARIAGSAGQRDATVSLVDEAGQSVQSWKLSKAAPVRFTGPPLGGKSSEVAMEELVLSAESIWIVSPH